MPAGARDAARFASQVAADPAASVGRWRAVTGGKAVGCLPPVPVPEILHAGGLLPVQLRGPAIPARLPSLLDAWVAGEEGPPLPASEGEKPRFEYPSGAFPDAASALEFLESLAEWAAGVSGRPVTEGALWKSIAAFRERMEFLRLLPARPARETSRPSVADAGDLARAGDFLPPEAHSLLLARVLGTGTPPKAGSYSGEQGDPLVFLARSLVPDNRKR